MLRFIPAVVLLYIFCCKTRGDLVLDTFPQSFAFGVSSSAFPTEGAWDVDGKGASIWDEFTKNSSHVQGSGDAKTSADGYNKIKEDVQLLKSLGVSHYKFSLSWPRLLPDGTTGNVNEIGFTYYNSLIDELLANQIEPFVTLYHWDLPQALQDQGGWSNDSSVAWFKDYANITFARFGDRVKLWITIDDPFSIAFKGYETGEHAPGIVRPDLAYKVGHNLILAHAEAYYLYRDTYLVSQNGQVGISLNSDWFVAKSPSAPDATATSKALTFRLGWFADPLLNGDYPTLMKERVALKRAEQGVPDQKMPEFTIAQQNRIRGALDFLGISHFKTKLVSNQLNSGSSPGYYNDQELLLETDTSYPKLEYRPEINPTSDKRLMGFGLKDLLSYITTTYNSPAIYVTSNGLESCGTLKDQNRIEYIREYSNNVLQAIQSGSDVRGYFVWSLLDGFDWNLGYTSKTGLYFVDFSLDDRPRRPRSSVNFYKTLIANRGLTDDLVTYRAYAADRDEFYQGTFPDYFLLGVATSAYQIEGAWNEDGKGPSIWDTFAHQGKIDGGVTGDVACDSYHLYMEDIKMLKELGVEHYRFSIAWTRLMPDGTTATLNQAGIQYYNNLIDIIISNNIIPMMTLFHWDLPQAIEDQGGWQNDAVVDLFEEYARVCFEQFGDRVKHWITFNEPHVVSWVGHGTGRFAPGITEPGFTVYRVSHNLIRSHSRAYKVYKDNFKDRYNGSVGITFDIEWKEPLTESLDDIMAADRTIEFKLGWFANPIFGGSGDYPEVMKQYVAAKSQDEGLAESRLPQFTDAEKQLNKGAYDFLGINYYRSQLVYNQPYPHSDPNWELDQESVLMGDPCWSRQVTGRYNINPWGIRYLLRWAKEHYNNPPIYITENGHPETDMQDDDKVYYLKYHINELLKAIRLDGVDLRGYTVWSLMDVLEWSSGYSPRFGLYHVDFDSPNRTRTPRASAQFYKKVLADNGFPLPPS